MAILVLQHDAVSRPGRLGMTLRDHAFRLDIRRLDEGGSLPPDHDDLEAVVSLGGAGSVHDRHAGIERECAFLRGAHERSLPVVGIGLGAQLVAHALGGTVEKMATPEVGWIDVDILPPGQTDTMLAGIAWRSPQLAAHAEAITKLPEDGICLARSEGCPAQAFCLGMRTYGFQFRFEADRALVSSLIESQRHALHQCGTTTQEFAAQTEAKYDFFARLGDRLCVNLATYLIPRVATATRI